MLEILLLGLAAVVIYLITHYCVMSLETWWGKPLGVWRSVWFFCIFLVLLIAAIELLPHLAGRGGVREP